jgi:hypothetical protein
MFLDKYFSQEPKETKEKIIIKGAGRTGNGILVTVSIDTEDPRTSTYLGTHNLTFNGTLIIGEHHEGQVGRSVVAA